MGREVKKWGGNEVRRDGVRVSRGMIARKEYSVKYQYLVVLVSNGWW